MLAPARLASLCALVALNPLARCAQTLSPEESRIAAYADAHNEELLALLRQTVEISSPTENAAGVRQVGAIFRREFDRLHFDTRWIDMPAGMRRAGHLFAEHPGTHGKRLLLIGHLDTVLPAGKIRQEGNKLYGSGAYDMKGGDLIMLYALKSLESAGALEGVRVIVAFSGDEESPGLPLEAARRDLIESAHRSDLALAFENSIGSDATVARRGSSSWKLELSGVSGHSAFVFSALLGDGAIYEAARVVDQFRLQLQPMDGLTCSPSMIVGGTEASVGEGRGTASGKLNVVAGTAYVQGDLRAVSLDQLEQARAKMRAIVSHGLRRTSGKITFEDAYPPMAATPENYALLGQLDQVSRDLGYAPVGATDPKGRGAGDISFVAPFLPCLDGLGARGGFAHAPTEFADVASFPELVKRTAILIYRLTR